MSRPKSDRTRKDRTRKQAEITPVFGRRPEHARVLGITEGCIRNFEAKGIGPAPIRIEGSTVVLHEFSAWVEWLRRNASHAA
jgi:hypothetical protein